METDHQKRLLQIAARQIRDQYFGEKTMLPLLLARDAEERKKLDLIDQLYQSYETSMQFGQYRRAVWYLATLGKFCQETFSLQATERRLFQLKADLGRTDPGRLG